MMSLKRQKCGECGYDYPRDDNMSRLKIGQEIVYLASKAIDDPWFCPIHRPHI